MKEHPYLIGYHLTPEGDLYSNHKRVSMTEWKIVPDYYKQIKVFDDGKGYLGVSLKRKQHKLHRLVAETYIPNPENLPCVNHKNGNRKDNRVCNLEWVTYQRNNEHGMSKSYKIKNTHTGEVFVIHNLSKWGRENNLIPSNLLRKKKDGTNSICKGFVLLTSD